MKSNKKQTGMAFILLAILTGCGTSHGIRGNALQPKDTATFPRVVQQVMRSIKGKTTIPLLAPTFVPTGSGYLTATTQPGGVSSKSYHVNMFMTKSPMAVNAPSLANSTVPEMASFGASRLGSAAKAIKDPIVKTIFLRIFSYSTSDVDGKIRSVFGARASSMVPPFPPPTLRAR